MAHLHVKSKTGKNNISYWSQVMSASVSDLDVLQPVGRGWGRGQGEVVSGRHPGLQALQLSGGSVRGNMLHQVALELV